MHYKIRAIYNDNTIRVYQAFNSDIALKAIRFGRFSSPFKMDRMTWIKPSFNWMMYRSNFASCQNQEHILGLDITRDGFNWLLRHGVLSNFDTGIYESHAAWKNALATSEVRIQWDPERDWMLKPIPDKRSLQIGVSGKALKKYIDEWIVNVVDVTDTAHEQGLAAQIGIRPEHLISNSEQNYPFSDDIRAKIVPNTGQKP